MDKFIGQKVLITGASGDIGGHIARAYAQEGAIVGLHTFRHPDKAERIKALIEDTGGKAFVLESDLTQSHSARYLIDEFVNLAGGLNILVNNAGSLVRRAPIAEMSLELWEQTFALNTRSVFLLTKYAIPWLSLNSHSYIVNMTSIAVHTGGSVDASHYASAKAAVSCFTMASAKELAHLGIRVNSVSPGFIDTRFHADGITPLVTMEKVKNITPVQRLGTPSDIARAVLFLTEDSADFITGSTLDINGGLLLRI